MLLPQKYRAAACDLELLWFPNGTLWPHKALERRRKSLHFLGDGIKHSLRCRTPRKQNGGRPDRHRKGHRITEAIGKEYLGRRVDRIISLSPTPAHRRYQPWISVRHAHAARLSGGLLSRRIQPERTFICACFDCVNGLAPSMKDS